MTPRSRGGGFDLGSEPQEGCRKRDLALDHSPQPPAHGPCVMCDIRAQNRSAESRRSARLGGPATPASSPGPALPGNASLPHCSQGRAGPPESQSFLHLVTHTVKSLLVPERPPPPTPLSVGSALPRRGSSLPKTTLPLLVLTSCVLPKCAFGARQSDNH